MRRILLIQTAFIGDAILATAALSSLKTMDFAVDVLVRRGNEIFFSNHPDCEKVLVWDKKGTIGKYASLLKISRAVKTTQYHAIVNLQRFAATGLLTALSGSKIKIGFQQNPLSFLFSHSIKHTVKERFHECNRNLELIRLAFPKAKYHSPNLYLNEQVLSSVNLYKKQKYICIFPGSVWFTKRLSDTKWVELIRLIPKEYKIYFLGAPNEFAMCDSIIQSASVHHNNMENLCGKMSLLQSAALGKNAEMNYCNDSSPVHFLSAVNAKVSSFFLSTDPIFGFYPVSDHSTVQAVENLPCKPCGIVGKPECPEGHFNCDKLLQVKSYLE